MTSAIEQTIKETQVGLHGHRIVKFFENFSISLLTLDIELSGVKTKVNLIQQVRCPPNESSTA
jgi:hypothetical protein